jgi:predicted RNA-binding protein with PUA-like domain
MSENPSPVDYDGNKRYWLFNTDETEEEGEGAYLDMLNQSVIAAWGNCKGVGAERTLNRPNEGETVFFYLAGTGIIAAGEVEGRAFSASTIFGQRGEYHRRVINVRRKLLRPLTFADVRENTGYSLPVHGCIVCQLKNEPAARYILQYFNVGPYG